MKSLLERVADHAKDRPARVRDATGMYIIAHRKQIQKTLDHGYNIKAIWETLTKDGDIKCSYPRFCQKLKLHLPVEGEKE